MNKEVEEAIIALSQIKKGYNKPVDFALPIIKQAFNDMEEERKDRDETEQSLSKWIVELQTEIKEATNIQADSYKMDKMNFKLN